MSLNSLSEIPLEKQSDNRKVIRGRENFYSFRVRFYSEKLGKRGKEHKLFNR